MTAVILGQVRFVLVTGCCGMAVMCGYDFWRFFRWLIPHSKLFLWIEDILYWGIMSVPVYAVFFLYNDGKLRWYGMLSLLLGGILYEKGISMPIRCFLGRILDKKKRRLYAFLAKRRRIYKEKKKMKSQRRKEEKRKRAEKRQQKEENVGEKSVNRGKKH